MQGPGDCQGRRPSLHSYLPRSCHPCAASRSSPAICKSDAFKICSQLQMQTASDSHQFPHKKISEIKSTGTCRQSVRIYIYTMTRVSCPCVSCKTQSKTSNYLREPTSKFVITWGVSDSNNMRYVLVNFHSKCWLKLARSNQKHLENSWQYNQCFSCMCFWDPDPFTVSSANAFKK